jgi:hypothetical protein
VVPGIIVGAVLGGIVGLVSLFVPAGAPGTSAAGGIAAPAPTRDRAAPLPGSASSPAGASSGEGAPDGDEADYLRRARAQLTSSPAQALAMAEAFPEKYPSAKLGQEREIIAIEALAGLGRTPEARARAKVFLTLFPESAHRRRLEALLPDLAGSEKKQAP